MFCFSSCGVKCLEGDLRVAGADKVEQLLAVLADEGLLVVASDVVPLDAIVVEVVQDGQARLTLLRQQEDRVFFKIRIGINKKKEARSIGSVALTSSSRLSGCGRPSPPVLDQSPRARWSVGGILASEPDQNHPLTMVGCKSARLHPSKSHLRPLVQMYLTPSVAKERSQSVTDPFRGRENADRGNESNNLQRANCCLMNSFSWRVSRLTASMQWRRQTLRASSQSTSNEEVAGCSQLKK